MSEHLRPDHPHHSDPIQVVTEETAGRAPLRRVPLMIGAGTALALGLGALLLVHARGSTNRVALASLPKPVTVVTARPATWREKRRYVGTVEPWISARVGPQFVSAYVETVLVRPGSQVSRGQVIATLDCRNASAADQAVAGQARAVEASQAALASEASRVSTLLRGGYASPDEAEMKQAESASKQAQLLGLKAQLLGSSLQVQDCVLRAPFEGEVAERTSDPGAFVRPGNPIATVVDRRTVRVVADVSEEDFDAVTPGTPVRVHLLATGRDLAGAIARRAPAADLSTRTVHVEIDLPDPDRSIPVGTTAEVWLDAGQPLHVTEIPLAAATVRGRKATLVLVTHGIAHQKTVPVEGEGEGMLYVGAELEPGSRVVTDGRGSLVEGDRVQATESQVQLGQAEAR